MTRTAGQMRVRCLCVLSLAIGLIDVPALADTAADPFARDLRLLTDWFAGEFDNEEQRWYEADPRAAIPEDDRVVRLHTVHERVDLPAFGEHVFYVEEYLDNDPAKVVRQRLVIFASAPELGAIRMRQGFFRSPDTVLGAHSEPGLLANIGESDVQFIDTCDVFWRRHAGQFEGAMKERDCKFGSGAERRYAVHKLTLSEQHYWRVDATFLVADDRLYKGYPIDKPMRMRRAKIFYCDVYFYSADSEAQIEKNLRLHSQGGMLAVTRQRDGQGFEVLVRDKEYPYYDTRPDFIYLSLRHAGERRSIAFSVNDPDSRQLGMRTEEIGAFCHRDGYHFRESLEQLP